MEIFSLTQRVYQLEIAIRFWNNFNAWLLAGTALFAVGSFITARMTFVRGNELAMAQKELLRAKDEQLALDLRSKDVGIEEAKRRAAAAVERGEELRQQNLATEKKLEEERLARLEIEDKVAFRRLTDKQKSELGSRLASYQRQTVTLWYTAGDHEGAIFATDIASALTAARWNVFTPASMAKFAPEEIVNLLL